MKKCILSQCTKEIPKHRKKSARYCSDECYYEAKKQRSSENYQALKIPLQKIKYQESILAFCYSMISFKKEVHFDDLEKMKFDWGFATRDVMSPNNQICKAIGNYCYFLNKDNSVSIWKLKSKT
jgi:hypothetical protein